MRRLGPTLFALLVLLTACGGGGGGGPRPPAFLSLPTERIFVGGVEMEAWIADTTLAQTDGLMGATAEDLAPLPDGTPRAMLFVFDPARDVSFWMRDTAVALDLAYAGEDGVIDVVHGLVPLDETPVPSSGPVGFALEALAGTLVGQGLGPGDAIVR